MDFKMPLLNGPEAACMIRNLLCEKSIDQPIIVGVTGYQDQENTDHALKQGMNVVFEKTPFPTQKLMELIVKCDIEV